MGLRFGAAVFFLWVGAYPGAYPAHTLGARCPGEAGRGIFTKGQAYGLVARSGRLFLLGCMYEWTVCCTVFCTVHYTALELRTLYCIVPISVYRALCSIVTVLRVVLCPLLCTELCVALCTELCTALRTAVYYTVYSTPHCIVYRVACCAPRWPQGPAQDGSS